uniref:Putative secreted protein n=1 Tax=Ixodes ricinus TaxID=34613 RepID=A0A6B0V1A0_IXORI
MVRKPSAFCTAFWSTFAASAASLCSLRCWMSLRMTRGIMDSATQSRSGGAGGLPSWALGPCRWQNPSSRMTLPSPQSQAPPAWLRNMLKSWPWWSPCWKQSAHSDMQGEMPHVRHRYATKLAVHTRPQVVALSYLRTVWENSSGVLPPAMSHLHQSIVSHMSMGFRGSRIMSNNSLSCFGLVVLAHSD